MGWATSFAGGHVLSLAGRGEDFAAIIAQVPHVSGPAAVRATGSRNKELRWTDESNQRFYAYNYFGDHPEKLIAWFDQHLK